MSRISIFAWWIILIMAFGFYPAAAMCVVALLLVGAPLYGRIVNKMDKKVEAKMDMLSGVSSFAAMSTETLLSLVKAGIYKGIISVPKFKLAEREGSHDDK